MSSARERQVRAELRRERWHWLRYRVWLGVPLWIAAAAADIALHAHGFVYFAVFVAVFAWSVKGPR